MTLEVEAVSPTWAKRIPIVVSRRCPYGSSQVTIRCRGFVDDRDTSPVWVDAYLDVDRPPCLPHRLTVDSIAGLRADRVGPLVRSEIGQELPSVTARAVGKSIEERIVELEAGLQEAGIEVSTEEAKKTVEELDARDVTTNRLQTLHDELQQLMPALEQFEGSPFGR